MQKTSIERDKVLNRKKLTNILLTPMLQVAAFANTKHSKKAEK